MISAETLLSAVASSGLCEKIEKVDLPEIKDANGEPLAVYVRTVRNDAFKQVLRSMSPVNTLNDEGRALALGCIALACDEKGQPLFTREHLPQLLKWPVILTNRIMKAGLKLNGMSEEAQGEIEKNYEATESGTST